MSISFISQSYNNLSYYFLRYPIINTISNNTTKTVCYNIFYLSKYLYYSHIYHHFYIESESDSSSDPDTESDVDTDVGPIDHHKPYRQWFKDEAKRKESYDAVYCKRPSVTLVKSTVPNKYLYQLPRLVKTLFNLKPSYHANYLGC